MNWGRCVQWQHKREIYVFKCWNITKGPDYVCLPHNEVSQNCLIWCWKQVITRSLLKITTGKKISNNFIELPTPSDLEMNIASHNLALILFFLLFWRCPSLHSPSSWFLIWSYMVVEYIYIFSIIIDIYMKINQIISVYFYHCYGNISPMYLPNVSGCYWCPAATVAVAAGLLAVMIGPQGDH